MCIYVSRKNKAMHIYVSTKDKMLLLSMVTFCSQSRAKAINSTGPSESFYLKINRSGDKIINNKKNYN